MSETRFYAIDCEDGPQFYTLVRYSGTRVVCWLLPEVKSEADLAEVDEAVGHTIAATAWDAAFVMWAGRRVEPAYA